MSIAKSIIMVYLGACILLIIPNSVPAETNTISLDDATIERCKLRMSKEPSGLIIFHIIDSETQADIDSVDVLAKVSGGKYGRPLREWRASWNKPGYHSFKVILDGYLSVVIDSVFLPADSAMMITLQMKKGESTLSDGSSVKIETASLDGMFSKNEIIGRMIDASGGNPISGATVYCEETDQRVSTDSLGEFILWLNLLKSVTINAWHPLYDSVRFEIAKEYIRTPKELEIYFETQRRTISGEPVDDRGDSAVLMLVDMMQWSSWGIRPHEFANKIYTYAVLPSEAFGPTSSWIYYDCLPFRFIRELPDHSAWVQFSNELGLITGKSNYSFLSDSAIRLNTHTLDAGTTVTLSLQPDYSPRGLIQQNAGRGPRNRSFPDRKRETDSCDIIKAQVERVHMKNILTILDGDAVGMAQSFSKTYKHPENRQNLPLDEFFKKMFEGKPLARLADKRILELFRLRSAEMYIHGNCGEPANERFLKDCEKRRFTPQDGDVYVHWPEASGGWLGGMSMVYRKENGNWKIVETF